MTRPVRPNIIAEIGSNCFKYSCMDKNFAMALMQIDGAKEAGATAVKFQMFTSEELWGMRCKDQAFAKLQNRFAMPPHWLPLLKSKCIRSSLKFMCSGFSVTGFETISPYVNVHKLASPEATNEPMLDYLMGQPKPVIVSLGCMRSSKIVGLLRKLRPSRDIVLECVSEYPASEYQYDLIKMATINKNFLLDWGVSDHTKGNTLAKYAMSMGAKYFEKHVDFYMGVGRETPDSGVSVNAVQFADYVKSIQSVRKIDYDVGKKLAHKLYSHRRSDCGHGATWNRPMPEWS